MRTHAWPASAATNGSSASASATSTTPAQTLGGTDLPRPWAVMGVPPRLRLSPRRCPQRGRNSRLGTALRRIARPPRLRLSPLRCPRRGRNSRLGAALRRSCALADPLAEQARRPENEHQDQHEEGENVLVVAAEHAHLALAGGALLLQRVGEKRESADI